MVKRLLQVRPKIRVTFFQKNKLPQNKKNKLKKTLQKHESFFTNENNNGRSVSERTHLA